MTDYQKILTNQKLSTRTKVIATLDQIHHGQSLSTLLDELLNNVDTNDKAFTHELIIGTLRQWWALNRITESLIDNEIADKAVLSALHIGLYQLLYMHTPDYAAINDTVEAIKPLNSHSTGLVNAILRKVANNPDKFSKKVQKNHSLPNYLAKILKQDWADYYALLGQNLRTAAPIFLRVNAKFCTPLEYSKLLNEQHIAHELVNIGVDKHTAIRLTGSVKISDLPKFVDGWVSVQDLHAQVCGEILADVVLPTFIRNVNNGKNINILDACTAPGGKLAHVLELFFTKAFHQLQPNIIALDNDEKRLSRVHANLHRLQLSDLQSDSEQSDKSLQIICGDATNFNTADFNRTDFNDTELNAKPFDVVILDAPCTATGVIRRHPDIGLLKTATDITNTVKLQADILQNLWQNVATNGYLLYITCSLLKIENSEQMQNFLANNPDANLVDFTLDLPNQIKQTIGYQCLPLNEHSGDGFYYALLQKHY
ncbi:16S rRNA m5C967 SAM-dependent methyltransferase [Moraxella macacae 0408225]|uniref:16S rRNA m5C967 SAM-dependent methyltransferase n=1 Tax=Moraxella macacae 0408225 TaxID=1230338 RepID=L2F974_9GAMM|nr:16S rRNA (cytosine(967)-C(5))-methyltransferase RsmB [Moraxella macacae]ELA09465.1 16S rRNA m5C967 SAM-dependent methyltransferase [Moraxella macacae 0408225]